MQFNIAQDTCPHVLFTLVLTGFHAVKVTQEVMGCGAIGASHLAVPSLEDEALISIAQGLHLHRSVSNVFVIIRPLKLISAGIIGALVSLWVSQANQKG